MNFQYDVTEQFFTTLRLFVCIVLPPAAACLPFLRPPHSFFAADT